MLNPIAACLVLLLSATSVTAHNYGNVSSSIVPTVTVKNGSYYGRYDPSYGTENFLGMPFAQPPVGNFRFRVPQSLNTSWSGVRNATEFGYECIGYGGDTVAAGNRVSEDCLTINVIKTHGSGNDLPVVVSYQQLSPQRPWLRSQDSTGLDSWWWTRDGRCS
jgi:triacylglycerol lipase